jgi:hypothetical protein
MATATMPAPAEPAAVEAATKGMAARKPTMEATVGVHAGTAMKAAKGLVIWRYERRR